jgi:hypothetical protein
MTKTTTIKILFILALAVALAPLAAQAKVAPQPAQNGNQTVVQTGVQANSFPDSFGG